MNKKRIGVFAALMAAVLMLSGCATLLLGPNTTDTASPSPTPSQDPSTVIVAEVNGVPIYKDVYNETYTQMIYTAYLSGQNIDSEETLSSIRLLALDQVIMNEVVKQKYAEKGYDVLSDEDMAQAEEDMVNDLIAYMEENCLDEVTADLEEDYTDEELRAAEEAYIDTLLGEYGYTRETYIETFVNQKIYENAYEAEVGHVGPTEQEITDRYNEYVAADKETITETPTLYATSVNIGETVYYIPEGVRMVREVLIPLDEEMAEAVSLLRSSGYDAAADILLAQGLADIKAQADEALGKLKSGTFDDLIAEYNPESAMPEEGYAVMEGATDHAEAYIAGALALEAVGDHSGLITTDDGYYILEFLAQETAGPIAYERVKDGIDEEISATMQDEAWDEVLEQWKSEASIQKYEGNL